MTTYTVYFRSDAEFATRDFNARTPEQALAKAQEFRKRKPCELLFEPYGSGLPVNPVNEIVVCDGDENELAIWCDDDDDLRLSLAARDLLNAAELVLGRWCEGDLAAAVRELDAAVARAKGGAA